MKQKISFREAAEKQLASTGTPIEVTERFLSSIVPDEGELNLIYGRIGQGKTTYAVTCMMQDLMRGQAVYSSFRIDWSGFDERQSFLHLFVGLLFPWYRVYRRFPRENWHYLDCYAPDIWDTLQKLNDCKIYFDDVIVKLFDSYEKTGFAKSKRQWAFETRHYDRSIILVTQRPNQVQVALRSQVNRFYKCQKLFRIPFLRRPFLRVLEYQDMVSDNVNEAVKPDSKKLYIPKKKVLNAFNTKYLRRGQEPSQRVFVDFFRLSYREKLLSFFSLLYSSLSRTRLKAGAGSPLGGNEQGTALKMAERLNTVGHGGNEADLDLAKLPF